MIIKHVKEYIPELEPISRYQKLAQRRRERNSQYQKRKEHYESTWNTIYLGLLQEAKKIGAIVPPF